MGEYYQWVNVAKKNIYARQILIMVVSSMSRCIRTVFFCMLSIT